MRTNAIVLNRKRKIFRHTGFRGLAFVLLVLILVALAYVMFRDMQGPEIILEPKIDRISPENAITLTMTDKVSFIKSFTAYVRYSGDAIPVAEYKFADEKQRQKISFPLKGAGLKDGEFTLEIVARDTSLAGFGRGNSTTLTKRYILDTEPPKISMLTPPTSLRRGGVAVFAYTVDEPVKSTGIMASGMLFPAYELQKGKYCCFITFPIDVHPAKFKPDVVATDLAGNTSATRIPMQLLDRKFRTDRLNISDAFLRQKALDFETISPLAGRTPIDRYVYINSEVRKQNVKFLAELAKSTSKTKLWKDEFVRLPGSALRANFGDSRTYFHNGVPVDHQVHMGIDLASTRQASIPAGNDGVVIYSGPLGIYGNLVVIDHGLGLMSLYSHMTQIFVSEGERVTKGQIIATTGTTGLAGGDHLHFGMLVNGIQVQPWDWLDKNWVKTAISDRIANAMKR